jgi:cell division septum initiation protein DivIVA
MALKSNQRNEQNVNLLKRHASAVERSFRTALDHVELFPPEEGRRIRQELTAEIEVFREAVKRFESRAPIREIRKEVAPHQDVRSWLIYRNMPSTIARYSHSQIDAADIAKRAEITARRLLHFHQRYEAALETVKELPMAEAQRREIVAKLHAEKQTMSKGFALYRRGFSFVDIDRITGIGIQNRALEGAIPETTRSYGGEVLSPNAMSHRRATAQDIRSHAQRVLAEAQKKNENEPADLKTARFDRITKELQNLELVLRMYERGLSPHQIKHLAKLPAESWILEGALPPTLLRSSNRLNRKDFRIPSMLDHETSYIVGAYLARARDFDQKSISFSAPTPALAQELMNKIERSFRLRPEPPRKVGNMYMVEIARKDFVSGFKRFFSIDAGSVVPCLDALIFYPYFRRPFLDGFLSFAGGSLNTQHARYSLTRIAQRELLAGIGVALSFEGIYPTLHNASERGGVLQVCDASELRTLIREFPQVASAKDLGKLHQKLDKEAGPMESLSVYLNVMQIIARHFPKGRRLDFRKIRNEGGLALSDLSFAPEERAKIKGWRLGHKPLVAHRAERLEVLARKLFHDRYSGV